MPDTTYLHIQGHECDPTRVVALPGAAVRVGRGSQCEVRLPEPELAEVQCLLRRRGDTWQIQPVGPTKLITIEGQPVEHLRSWPFGVPLQVGTHRLVIRPSQWGTYQAPFEVGERFNAQRAVDPEAVAPPTESSRAGAEKVVLGSSEAEVERLRRWQARLEQRERWLQSRQEEKKWGSRWRAAGEGLRSRSTPPSSPRPDVSEPAASIPPKTIRTTSAGERVLPPSPIARTSSSVEGPKPPQRQIALPRTIPSAITPPAEPPVIPVEPKTEIESASRQGSEDALELSKTIESDPSIETSIFVDEIEFEPKLIHPIEGLSLIESDHLDPARVGSSPFVVEMASNPSVFSAEVTSERETETLEVEPLRDPVVVIPSETAPRRDEYPSAAAIFAAQGTRAPTRVPAGHRGKRRPMPTELRAPAEWVLPARLAGPPTALAAIGLTGVGLILGVSWSKDNLDAGMAATSALRAENGPPAPIDPNFRPEVVWWKTTAGHLAHWAVAIKRSPEAQARADEVREILGAASQAAPLQTEIRLALAQTVSAETTETPLTAVGLSRDVVSLTLSGRVLKRSGKVESAIRAYRRAMELASEADPARLDPPDFDDDPQVRRFRLPHEALIQSVVRDMLDVAEWKPDEWTRVVPSCPLARLAVARTLREKGISDADKLFDLALAEDASLPDDTALAAENLAAKAEALAFKQRKTEAAEGYRKAIEVATDDITRRRWRLGLAEILGPLGASKERAEMLEAAMGPDPTEDVTRKALDAQKLAGLR